MHLIHGPYFQFVRLRGIPGVSTVHRRNMEMFSFPLGIISKDLLVLLVEERESTEIKNGCTSSDFFGKNI